MRRVYVIGNDPVSIILTLQEAPDSPGCVLNLHAVSVERTVDAWDRHFPSVDQALRAVQMTYGVGPGEWSEL